MPSCKKFVCQVSKVYEYKKISATSCNMRKVKLYAFEKSLLTFDLLNKNVISLYSEIWGYSRVHHETLRYKYLFRLNDRRTDLENYMILRYQQRKIKLFYLEVKCPLKHNQQTNGQNNPGIEAHCLDKHHKKIVLTKIVLYEA